MKGRDYHSRFTFHVSRFFFVFTFCFSVFSIHYSSAQDTLFRNFPEFTKYVFLEDPDSLHSLDTTIDFFHRFHPSEKEFANLHLGYLGAPSQPMYLTLNENPGIDIGFHQFDRYWRSIDEVKFYDTKEPFTSFKYQQGSRSEIAVHIIHTQNITKRLSFGADFNRYRTNGWYQRQESRISNFDAFAHYASLSKKYHGIVSYVLNDVKVDENGGVRDQNLFNEETLFDKTLADVWLDSARTRWKNDEVMMLNALQFGRWVEANKKDTLSTRHIIPMFRIQERIEWERRSYRFDDRALDGAYYTPDTIAWRDARDTFSFDRIMNEVRVSKLNRDTIQHKSNFAVSAFLRHSIFYTHNAGFNTNYQEAIIGGELNTLLFAKINFKALGGFNFADRNRGDYNLGASLSYYFSPERKVSFEAIVTQNHPTLVEQNYHSSWFNWQNDFNPMNTELGRFSYSDTKWRLNLSAEIFTQSDYIYWDSTRLPVQYGGSLSGARFFLQKDFSVWRLHLDNELMYQNFNADSIISYPPFVLRTSFYYEDKIFQRALHTKIGVDVTYNSDYFAPAYVGATGQFLVQHNTELNYYPVLDAFVSLRIRGVRAFIMFQHVNQGLFRSGYFTGIPYPAADRAFKIGFEWMFWN